MAARYAIYFAPRPKTWLWAFGSRVLGYDAAGAEPVPQLVPEGFEAEHWRRLTAAPRRYGFHATLKAPFRLAEGRRETDLRDAVRAFAAGRRSVAAPALEVRAHEGYATLMLAAPSPETDALAADCVRAFEPFRAPLSTDELARRRPYGLSARQRGNLERWGYPYVLEEFRFHMSLAGPVPDGEAERVRAGLARLYAAPAGAEPLVIDQVALFAEPERGGDFVLIERGFLAAMETGQ